MVIKKVGQVALILTILLIANITLANSDLKEEKTINFIVTPSVAYRYDVFKYSIPHHQLNMKVSELVWKNYIAQPSIKIEIEPQQNQFTILGKVKYGYILKNPSKSWDYDWFGNSAPFSKTLSDVRGNILDLSGAVGYSVNLFNNNLLTFYFGYDYSDYRNKQYGIRQQANNLNNLLHPFNQLISKYYFKTQAPWISLSVNTELNDRWSIIPTIKLYSFNYAGKGYWLLRDDLKQKPSFKQKAKGRGLGFDVDFLYKYSDNLDFKINLETKKFKMKKGTDQTFYNNTALGGERAPIRKLLNLSLISSSISIGLNYKI
jgi:hypothetical protein